MDRIQFKILGVDPGFRDLGTSRIRHEVDARGKTETKIVSVRSITTSAKRKIVTRNGKRRVAREEGGKNNDRRRLDEIADAFHEEMVEFGAKVVAFEAMPFVRNARTTAQIALAWSACYTLATRLLGAKVLVYEPRAIKLAVCGNDEAEKEEVFQAITALFPDFDGWPLPVSARWKSDDPRAHVADATGAGLCAIESPQVVLAVAAWRRKMKATHGW